MYLSKFYSTSGTPEEEARIELNACDQTANKLFHVTLRMEAKMDNSRCPDVNPMPYKCSLESIASGLQLNKPSAKPPPSKNKILKAQIRTNSEKEAIPVDSFETTSDVNPDLLRFLTSKER